MSKSTRLNNLDMLRGIAAFLVLSGHLRSYIFKNYDEFAQASLLDKAFYFATGMGHQAVIIFFALSGFLVGGKVLEDILNNRFFWPGYLLRRLTRLWIVIIPVLLLTLLLDKMGIFLTNGRGYCGQYYSIYNSGPYGPAGIDHSFLTFLGNLGFLQTVYVPTFGSNGPMWSLANEFWYYIIFPLAFWVGLARITAPIRTVTICLFFAFLIVLPMWLLKGGIIWAAGAAAAWCTRREQFTGLLKHFITRVGAMSLFFATLVLTRTRLNEIGDLELGIAVALALPVLATLPSPAGLYRALARVSSDLSYTLYLTHFPLLTLMVLAGFAPDRLEPSAFAAGLYAALLSLALIWAAIVWWCFERNTDHVYSLISTALLVRTRST